LISHIFFYNLYPHKIFLIFRLYIWRCFFIFLREIAIYIAYIHNEILKSQIFFLIFIAYIHNEILKFLIFFNFFQVDLD
jgi:hypothetical protein